MDTKNIVTTPKEVELTENNERSEKLDIDVQINFCIHVGWDGT